jgi:hypothetical protein
MRGTIEPLTRGWKLNIPKGWCNFTKVLRDGQQQIPLSRAICRPLLILDTLSVWGGINGETDGSYIYEFDSSYTIEALKHMILKLFNRQI